MADQKEGHPDNGILPIRLVGNNALEPEGFPPYAAVDRLAGMIGLAGNDRADVPVNRAIDRAIDRAVAGRIGVEADMARIIDIVDGMGLGLGYDAGIHAVTFKNVINDNGGYLFLDENGRYGNEDQVTFVAYDLRQAAARDWVSRSQYRCWRRWRIAGYAIVVVLMIILLTGVLIGGIIYSGSNSNMYVVGFVTGVEMHISLVPLWVMFIFAHFQRAFVSILKEFDVLDNTKDAASHRRLIARKTKACWEGLL